MTNSDIMIGQGDTEETKDTRKRGLKNDYVEEAPMKKIKLEEPEMQDDSGYQTTHEDSQLNLGETSLSISQSELLNNLIQENVGEVNMLDDSLGLIDQSVDGVDLVNDMYAQLDTTLSTSHDDINKQEIIVPEGVAEDAKPAAMSDLRKLFHGEEVSFSLSLLVVQVNPAFKKNILEVELSDGEESSNNFFFKMSSPDQALRRGLRLRLGSMKTIGARICVDAYEIIGEVEETALDNTVRVEEDFFINLRRVRMEDSDLFEVRISHTDSVFY